MRLVSITRLEDGILECTFRVSAGVYVHSVFPAADSVLFADLEERGDAEEAERTLGRLIARKETRVAELDALIAAREKILAEDVDDAVVVP